MWPGDPGRALSSIRRSFEMDLRVEASVYNTGLILVSSFGLLRQQIAAGAKMLQVSGHKIPGAQTRYGKGHPNFKDFFAETS